MAALLEFGFHLAQLRLHPLPHGVPVQAEPALPRLAADVRKAKEVEGLRLPGLLRLPSFGGVPLDAGIDGKSKRLTLRTLAGERANRVLGLLLEEELGAHSHVDWERVVLTATEKGARLNPQHATATL